MNSYVVLLYLVLYVSLHLVFFRLTGVDLSFLCVVVLSVLHDGGSAWLRHADSEQQKQRRRLPIVGLVTRLAFATTSSKPPSPSPPFPSESPSPSPQPTRTSKSEDRPSSRRKPCVSASAIRSSRSKKVKVAHAPAKLDRNARYFDPSDASNARNGTIDTVGGSTPRIQVSSGSDSL
ncbi:hypothetical protein HD554DRAFT_1578597 [Boletus coccyginus]|nr:hypothetical protein HD554DRAFT_1578597 [Boletus coccyginus]